MYFGAPVEGEGVSDGEMGPWGSGMHSRSRSLWQQMDAASGSRAMMSCLGLSAETRPACTRYRVKKVDSLMIFASIG